MSTIRHLLSGHYEAGSKNQFHIWQRVLCLCDKLSVIKEHHYVCIFASNFYIKKMVELYMLINGKQKDYLEWNVKKESTEYIFVYKDTRMHVGEC